MSVGGVLAALRGAFCSLLVLSGFAPSAWAAEVTYTYDRMGRLLSARYPNNTLVVYEYDRSGNRLVRRAESCVGPELAPTAGNDSIDIYVTLYFDEETQTSFFFAEGTTNVEGNDSDPSSFPLTTIDFNTNGFFEGFSLDGGVLSFNTMWTNALPGGAWPTSVYYTVSNGHCQTDIATVAVTFWAVNF